MEYMENMEAQAVEQPETLDMGPPAEEGQPDLTENIPVGEEDGQDGQEEKPKRGARRKKTELDEEQLMDMAGDDLSGFPPLEDIQREEQDDAYEGGGEEDPLPQDAESGELIDAPAPARSRRRSRGTVTLDSAGNIIREQSVSGSLHDISILTAARNGRRVLTATVDAIEEDGNSLPRVVFYVGTVKVLIPFEQMGLDLDSTITSQREARLLIDSMLGARIDYMVRGIDTEAKIAAASRRDAMLVRQRTILNARGTSREYRIEEGMRVTARVIHVSQYAVRVEVYGFETYVPIGSVSNLWVRDIRQFIQVGEERPVEITELVRGEDGRVTSMRVSIRAAEDVTELELQEGYTYTGHISGFSETAYFVRVKGVPTEVRCPVKSNHTMELLSVGDLVKFYIRGVHDGVPTGAVLKVLKKHIVSEF